MSLRGLRRMVVVLVPVCILGCASAPPPRVLDPELRQAARVEQLEASPEWTLIGKIAVSDAGEGGSGRVVWRQRGTSYEIEVSAPVSRRSWRLIGDSNGARLEGLEGGTRVGDDASELLQREVGWIVPIEHLSAWARGLPGRGESRIDYGQGSLPARIEQAGWNVEYRAWSDSSPALPEKVFARQGERRVRLVIQRWILVPGRG
jgi:outer membrane lipoprotein LolB